MNNVSNPFDSPDPNAFMRDGKATDKQLASGSNPSAGDAVISIDDVNRGGQIHISNASVRLQISYGFSMNV